MNLHAVHEASRVVTSALPALAVAVPLAGGICVLAAGDRRRGLRDGLAIAAAAGAFLCCALMAPAVFGRSETLSVSLPLLFGDFTLAVDSMGLLFATLASFVWAASTIYGRDYMRHEERQAVFHAFSLFTEAATLGVFLAGDFFSLYVFFEAMGLLAYLLVVHTRTGEALYAGRRYIFLAIYGGLSLLMGVLLFTSYSGGAGFHPAAGAGFLATSACFIATAFLLGGFGVKAGMVPLHVWLPLAHPAAPSPASALLSGVMIKAGAYGFLRTIGAFYPAATGEARSRVASTATMDAPIPIAGYFTNLHYIGVAIIILAAGTMLVGMALALFQDNAKRLLAYSSISQMGFILLGIGTAAYLGPEGSLGISGSLYHALNHGFFKALLFLAIGAVYYTTHNLDLRKGWPVYRDMPVTTLLACLGGLGLVGITFFNGFVSKSLLHHSVTESLPVGGWWFRILDWMFYLAAAGTTCYVIKLLYMTFFKSKAAEGEPPKHVPVGGQEAPWPMLAGMGALAAGVVFLGVFPGAVLRDLVIPAVRTFAGLEPHGVEHLSEIGIFTWSNLWALVVPVALGTALFLVMYRYDLFRLRLPSWAGIDFYYTHAETGFLAACFRSSTRWRLARAALAAALAGTAARGWRLALEARLGARDLLDNLGRRLAECAEEARDALASVSGKLYADLAFGVVVFAVAAVVLALLVL